ncbi:MAG: AraC family transcriptional regulator [Betaproteobacteria bacterium]|nr:AraC family transcriptional regulator [Betaproteobacteria bacterium]
MIEPPEIVRTASRTTAVIPLVTTRAEIATVMDAAIAEVHAAILAQGLAPAGPLFSFHHRRPTDTFEFEVGFPVEREIVPAGRVRPGRLPEARVVRTTYRGPYEGLGEAWGEFVRWIEARALPAQDRFWEAYVSGPESGPDPATWRTELVRVLEPES